MVFHNDRQSRLRPITPIEAYISFGTGFNEVTQDEKGLYERRDIPVSSIADTEFQLIKYPAQVGVSEWQIWGQGSWKAIHGSYKAVTRFAGKLDEEYRELFDSIKALYGSSELRRDQAQKGVLSELGDMAWVTLAITSNAGTDIDHRLKTYLYECHMGTQYISADGSAFDPPWLKTQVAMATNNQSQLTLGDLDRLIAEGFIPKPSAAMNIFCLESDYDDDDEKDIITFSNHMLAEVMALANISHQQFGWGGRELPDGRIENWVNSPSFRTLGNEVGRLAAKTLLQLAYIAHESCNSTLAEVAQLNHRKLTGRVALGLLDKSDGERPEELL